MVLCAAMSEIGTLEQVLWGLSFSFNLALVFLLLYRKNYRVYPCFLLYALLNLFQAVIIFASLQRWSFGWSTSYKIAWGTQGMVVLARAVSVGAVCRRDLAKYWGRG